MSDDATTTTVLQISDKARAKVLEVRAQEANADDLALWVEVNGSAGGNYTYDLWFEAASEATADDAVQRETDGLTVVVPADSVDKLRGATLDMGRDLLNPGMVIQNPNRPAATSAAPLVQIDPSELTGDVSERVAQVLDRYVNPAVASHGGHADLVRVEGDAAYLRLSGGCAGCGMAAVTLSQGIEVAITQAVPEITRIVDVTDHASGTNPFYEPAAP